MIKKSVELFLEKYDLLKPKNNIIVAFSGGYDSLCLLDVMKSLSADYNMNLIAIHLNHGWRGAESDAEEERCRQFASDIIFYSERLSADVPHTETAAREKRYEFFEKCAKQFNSNVVLTAHNANDNAETVFYRITKGTGITGLEGIRENRGIYYRPLLSIYRSEIEEYCNKKNLVPNFDSSNMDSKYARNKIRNEIFPMFPDIEKRLNELSEAAANTNRILESELKPLENYSTKEFISLDAVMQNLVVHKFFRNSGLDYDKKVIERIVDFIIASSTLKSGSKISLSADKWLFVNSSKIAVISKSDKLVDTVSVTAEGEYSIGNYKFSIRKMDLIPEDFPEDSKFKAYISIPDVNFTLRTRRDGDVISPLGLGGTQKFKKYLISKHIPAHERDNIILLTRGNDVLWAAGIGLSESVKVTSAPVYEIKLKGKL